MSEDKIKNDCQKIRGVSGCQTTLENVNDSRQTLANIIFVDRKNNYINLNRKVFLDTPHLKKKKKKII
jgi:hypothetical protein